MKEKRWLESKEPFSVQVTSSQTVKAMPVRGRMVMVVLPWPRTHSR